MQCVLSALVAIIIALAPVFNIPLTVVPPAGKLSRSGRGVVSLRSK